jgi:CRP/FNR family transcriptional regulator, dissimilatory nitrate respiration regulator
MTGPVWLPADLRARSVERRLKAGEVLFRQGKRTAGLYQIVKGKVRLVRVDRAGREVVLYVGGPGDTIAEASLFAAAYHCDAIASTDAVVRLYPKAAVLLVFQRDAKSMQAFMAMLAHQVMTLRTRLELRNIHSARDRVHHFLAVNAESGGGAVTLTGTLKDLAAELGLSHEALYRTLAQMSAAGEIERRGRTIRLTKTYDPDHI